MGVILGSVGSLGSLESLPARALGPLNWALGIGYAVWVVAAVLFARRAWTAAMTRVGLLVGLAVLAAGVVGSVRNDKAVARLAWPGVVYPATALVIWLRRPRTTERSNDNAT